MLYLIVAGCLVVVFLPMGLGATLKEPGTWIGVAAMVLVLVICWLFRKLVVQLTPTHLNFGFPIWKVTLSTDDFDVGDVVNIPITAGAGVHYWRGKTFFNARMGSGLEIVTEKRTYVIGSDDPEQLSETLRAMIGEKKQLTEL
jgi:hypothetical protein